MKHRYIAYFAVSALSLAACGRIAPEIPASDTMRFEILTPGQRTKVAAGAFEENDSIGIFVTDYADAATPMPLQCSGNRATNLSICFDGSAWTPERTVYWGEGKSDVYAYYPYSESVPDVNSLAFSVATDQSGEGYPASDFLWAKAAGVTRQDGAVNLAMKHSMSKLTVRLVAGEKYVGSLPSDASVLLHSTVADALVDLETGAAVKNPYSGAKSIRMNKVGIRNYEGADAVVYEAIVVPQMLETSVPLIEINSKSVSYLLEDRFNFRPGVAYTYTATLNASTTAIRVDIGCEIEDWNGGSSSGEGGGDNPGGDAPGQGDDDTTAYSDLSAGGTANCYLVQKAGDYKFKAVQGNTDGTVGNVKSVEVLWESFGTDVTPNVGDIIASASYKDGYIRFSTPETFAQGNALIAAKSAKGTILWSWHIWCAEEGWKEQVYFNNAGTMMDRNLGATSATPGDAGCNGLMYQWGRKDPFLGAASVSSSIRAVSTGTWETSSSSISYDLAEQHPMTFYFGYDNYLPYGSWDSEKTAFDPCPAGWRVPDGGDNGVWATAAGSSKSFYISQNSYGLNFSGTFGSDQTIWYPASGYLSYGDGALYTVGNLGNCWSVTPGPSFSNGAYCLDFYSNGDVSPSLNGNHRSSGWSVRCLQE